MKWNYILSLVPNDTHVDSKLCDKFNQANKEFSPSLADFIALKLPYICPGWIYFFLIQLAKIWPRLSRDFCVMVKYSPYQAVLPLSNLQSL